jgi:cytochrome c-type biogenesis protein CcmH/NrfF
MLMASVLVGEVAPAARAQPPPRASASAIERQVMCVTCKIPLPEAESPQADRERAYIKQLADRGLTEAQIKNALVSEYGPAVLALPSSHGLDLAVYVVPPAAALAGLLVLVVAVRRWRRVGGAQQDAWGTPGQALGPADASRLDRDLARYDS